MEESLKPLMTVENLSRTFLMDDREIKVLDGVDLTINQGEMLGVMGASGAGKSTLLLLMGALDRPTGGSVRYGSTDIFALTEREKAYFRAREIGFVFQSNNLLPEFSAEENVALAAMIAGADKNESLKRARELLGLVGLSGRLAHRPGKLSGGEQQRVALARALVNGPGLLLADEPTGNLDTATGEEVFELMAGLNGQRGQTFVIVTHNPQLAERMTRVIRIRDGKIVDTGADVIKSA
ncbi:MAG: ABC transporter ATP-binding protein [Nitrospinae bacterium]|nr:ABC transporter ATP-binding protein [Nitrospinota bacterium]